MSWHISHDNVWHLCTTPVVVTVGVAVTDATSTLAGVLTDYSYINAPGNETLIARCLTGLGPSDTSNGANGVLGGWYFDGTMIPNSDEQGPCASDVIQVRPGAGTAGVINLRQCGAFSTSVEGIYTCTMMTSSGMDQSVRLGVYLTGRSESLDLLWSIWTDENKIAMHVATFRLKIICGKSVWIHAN